MTSRIYDFNGRPLQLVADGNELVRCHWIHQTMHDAGNVDGPVDSPPEEQAVLDKTVVQLDEYKAGTRRLFELPLRPVGTDFQMLVWEELQKISYGTTISYGLLARRIGHPNACRAVANACGANPIAVVIPCHRVTAAAGRPGGYAGGLDIKLDLLRLEQPTVF